MATETPKKNPRRSRRRGKGPKPRSAEEYAQWKARLASYAIPTSEPGISQAMPKKLTMDDHVSGILSTQTAIPLLESQAKERALRKKIFEHAALVAKQSRLAKAAKKEFEKKKRKEEEERRFQPFRFESLPRELRDMVYRYMFEESSGGKPRLLWALKEYSKLHGEARIAWCQYNDFKFSLSESKVNTREELNEKEMQLLKRATLLVWSDIQPCTPLSLAVLQAPNLQFLTLEVSSKVGLGLAIHNVIPCLKKLKKVTLHLGLGKTRKQRLREWTTVINPHLNNTYAEAYRNMTETRKMLDKMLGMDGRYVGKKIKPWYRTWVWEVEGKDEVFKPKKAKKHIKFDEE